MSKPFKYNQLSRISCAKCGKKVKLNVLARKPETRLCYRCGADQNKNSTARDVRNNPALKRRQLHYNLKSQGKANIK